MLTILFISMLICIILLSKVLYNNFISPLSVFLGNYLFSLIIFYQIDFLYRDLSNKAVLIIFLSLAAFFIGSFIATFIKISLNRKRDDDSFSVLKISKNDIKIFRKLFWVSIAGFIYYLYIIQTKFGLINILINPNLLNLAYGDISEGSLPLYMMKVSMVNSMFLFLYILKFKCKKIEIIIMFIIEVLMNISVKRNRLLYIIVLNSFIFLYYNRQEITNVIKQGISRAVLFKKKNNFRKIIIILVIVVLFGYFFISMQSLLNKQSAIQGFLMGIKLPSGLVTIITYWVANFASFNIYLSTNLNDVPFLGCTLRFVYKILDQLHIIKYDDTFLAMDFVYVPNQYNTTLGQFYIYTESGIFGLIVFYALIGFISTRLFVSYQKTKDDISLLYLTFFSTLLLFNIREYVMIFVDFWILLIAIILLRFRIRKRTISINKKSCFDGRVNR
jgi:oligosaccharide repeat unit polymerase